MEWVLLPQRICNVTICTRACNLASIFWVFDVGTMLQEAQQDYVRQLRPVMQKTGQLTDVQMEVPQVWKMILYIQKAVQCADAIQGRVEPPMSVESVS